MIVTTETNEVRQSERDPQFDVDSPRFNPLAANVSLSIIKGAESLDLRCGPVASEEEYGGSISQISAKLIERSRQEVQRRPRSARAHTRLGIAFLNSGDIAAAIQELEVALAISPEHYVASTTLAKIKVDMEDFDGAEVIYRRLQNIYPENATVALSLAQIAIRKADYQRAADLLRVAIRLGYKAVTAKYYLAMVLLKLGRNRESIMQLRQAIQSEVRAPFLYEALGIAYASIGDSKRALVAFKTALVLAPSSESAVHSVAQIQLSLNQVSEAKELLRQHLDKNPDDLVAKELLARVYRLSKQYKSAIAQELQVMAELERRKITDPKRFAWIANNIGVSHFDDGNLNEAETWFRKSIATDSNLGPLAFDNLGRLYLRRGNISNAISILRESRQRFPKNEASAVLLGAVLTEEGLIDEAITLFQPLVGSGGATNLSYGFLAALLCDEKAEYEKAIKLSLECYARGENDPVSVNLLAYVYLMAGEPVQAREILEKHRDLLKRGSKIAAENRVTLTATWGLLYIVEGSSALGEEWYRKAYALATELGYDKLALAVMQKLHLELARASLRAGDVVTAKEQVRAGLAVKNGIQQYERELKKLSSSISL